ncbi:phospholipid carrier-dependent glycosyltransferase [Actinocrinis puniceicyclus]|uniref:Polyprenol-phosphate-mannose--protein mannosyltransferase n=1 Tax=Actinocrinis puniceicyclus TaxID=977794 RepID=A0A8J7WS57_9ACTN|nr:phospholipid carrier-dependent glycosyltransferase [Actinocrinis puniceicyclus]MBS2965457.1 phospholipid carrier-dependent glycosyltransferase [Actinocrinis puniceicyclus]
MAESEADIESGRSGIRGLIPGRLSGWAASATLRGWAGPLAVAGIGAWLRFADLSTPQDVVFDEAYYAPQAYGILRFGAEHVVSSFTDSEIVGGKSTDIFVYGGQFAAHPPFGKVEIAAGEWLFGLNPFGWRFAAAFAGSLAILLLARITRRLTGSTLLGCVAGLLLALDGLELVMSRTAMLDVFVMFWALAGFGCLVIDRDRRRARLAEPGPRPEARPDAHARSKSHSPSPSLPNPPLDAGAKLPPVRWWRLGAGVCLGLAASCKWNGLYFLVGLTLLSLAWDGSARAAAASVTAARRPRVPIRALLRDGAGTVAGLWPAAAVAYLATWRGWFTSTIGWDRYYAQQHGVHTPVISTLYSWFEYQREMFVYDTSLDTPNTFASHPWTWPLLTHPVRFYYAAPRFAENHCAIPAGCVQNVLAVGTPAIWWPALAALAVAALVWLRRRDWRFGAALAGVAAGWLPWFAFPGRTQYFYYAVSFEPFLILALTLCLGLLPAPRSAAASVSRRRRLVGGAVVAGYLVVVALNLAYLYPVLTGRPISYVAWIARMLMPDWV